MDTNGELIYVYRNYSFILLVIFRVAGAARVYPSDHRQEAGIHTAKVATPSQDTHHSITTEFSHSKIVILINHICRLPSEAAACIFVMAVRMTSDLHQLCLCGPECSSFIWRQGDSQAVRQATGYLLWGTLDLSSSKLNSNQGFIKLSLCTFNKAMFNYLNWI